MHGIYGVHPKALLALKPGAKGEWFGGCDLVCPNRSSANDLTFEGLNSYSSNYRIIYIHIRKLYTSSMDQRG